MQLDRPTLSLLLVLLLFVQCFGWLLVWRGHRQVPGVHSVLIGMLIILAGAVMVALRGWAPYWLTEVAAHWLAVLGLCYVTIAVAEFFHRPVPHPLLGLALALFLIASPLLQFFATDADLARSGLIGAYSAYFAFLAAWLGRPGYGSRLLMQDFFITIQVLHGVAGLLRMGDAALMQAGMRPLIPAAQEWIWLFEAILYAVGFFLALITLLQARLADALGERNRSLKIEARERAELERRLSVAVAQQETARREQQDFFLMVGHEFRTPLAIIDRAAEMIELKLPDQGLPMTEFRTAAQQLGLVPAATRRLRLMINCFLAAERVQQGGQLNFTEIELRALLILLQELAPRGEDGTTLLRVDGAPPDETSLLQVDQDVLRAALAYLCDLILPGTIEPGCCRVEQAAGGIRILLAIGTADPPPNGFSIAAWLVETQHGRVSIHCDSAQRLWVEIFLPARMAGTAPGLPLLELPPRQYL